MISVVIPTTRPGRVARTVDSLWQGAENDSLEVILVTPHADELPDEIRVRSTIIETESVHPPGHMRNLGAADARGDIICFVDDDCIVPEAWAATIARALDGGGRIGAVGCRVVGPPGYWSRCADYSLFAPYQFATRSLRDLGSAAIAVRREAFEQAGGFDPELRASEDWEFCLRLHSQGWDTLFDPTTTVRHEHGRDRYRKIMRSAWDSGHRSGLTVQMRHRDQMSRLAKLSILLSHPGFYWLLIIPYAFIVSLALLPQFARANPRYILYLPVVIDARIGYHAGVWSRLNADNRKPRPQPKEQA